MQAVDDALYDVLAGDALIVGLLSTFRSAPAIITVSPLPEGVVPPFVAMRPPIADEPFDSKTCWGRRWMRDIGVYQAADGKGTVADTVAERIRALLHRYKLPIDGMATMLAKVSGPVEGPTDDTMYGLVLTVELVATYK